MTSVSQDLRFALRQLRKSPGFAVVAIVSLALGIGATTAVFSVIYGVLLNPYPYRDADRMMHVELVSQQYNSKALMYVNRQEYEDLLGTRSIEDSFTVEGQSQTLTGSDMPATVQATLNSPNIFTFLGVSPLLGRTFTNADTASDPAPSIAVLSYLFWNRQFGGKNDVVGKTIELNHKPYMVIGVMPPRFTWFDADVYLPALQPSDPRSHRLAFSRLRPGVTYKSAEAELGVLASRWSQQDVQVYPKDIHVKIASLNDEVMGRFSGTLTVLFGSVVLLLLVGCGNVSILLLARGSARQHELALRSAVGAARSRIIRQLLTESLLLSMVGAVAGVLLAYGGVALIKAWLPHYSFPHEAAIAVSTPVLAATAVIALLTGIIFGVSPAWQLSRPETSQLMTQSGTTRLTGSVHGRRTHEVLIGAQVAITMLLLVAAATAARSFMKLYRTPLGFDPEHVLAFQVVTPRSAYPTWEKRANAMEQFREAVAKTPGVMSAAISTTWLPPFPAFDAPLEFEGRPSAQQQTGSLTLVSPDLFSTLRIPLLAGRNFTDGEHARAAHVALVNKAAVKRYFNGQSPIGQHVRSPMLKVEQPDLLMTENPDGWLEIIGVVGDARNEGIDHPPGPAIYLPSTFVVTPNFAMLVRTAGDPEAVLPSIGRQVRAISNDVALSNEHSIVWWLWSDAWGRERFAATLLGIFGMLALVLAATGLYGVVSYSVAYRTREFGLRYAVGAQKLDVVKLVLRSAAVTVGAGIAIGMVLSLALSRIMALWAGGSGHDPAVLLLVAVVFIMVAGLACMVPASRAAAVDPMRALRTE